MEKDNVIKMKKHSASDLNRFIEFTLGAHDYAIPLSMVREVISVPDTTPIPMSPAHFLGFMNLRGQVISIVDLRLKLKVETSKDIEEAVIIVDIAGMNIGDVVDSINKVLAFSSEEVTEVPEVEGDNHSQYTFGIFKKEHSQTTLLDIAKVLDLKDMEAISGIKRAA